MKSAASVVVAGVLAAGIALTGAVAEETKVAAAVATPASRADQIKILTGDLKRLREEFTAKTTIASELVAAAKKAREALADKAAELQEANEAKDEDARKTLRGEVDALRNEFTAANDAAQKARDEQKALVAEMNAKKDQLAALKPK